MHYLKHPAASSIARSLVLIAMIAWFFSDVSAAGNQRHRPTGLPRAERVAAQGANRLTEAEQPAEVRADDTWTPTSTTNAPSARSGHTAVWTGTQMIVWGGGDNTGQRYNPEFSSWTPISMTNAPPSAQVGHTAVWTGTEMIVWGGFVDSGSGSSSPLDTGGRYNPTTDTWRPTSTANAPSARGFHTAVWTGTEMIVWGGSDDSRGLGAGGRYNPATDTWKPVSETNAPGATTSHTAVWTGTAMIIWGGYKCVDALCTLLLHNTGGRYDPATDSWTSTSTINAPAGRESHTAVWTGTEMIIWGGGGATQSANVVQILGDGGRYNPATDTWMPMSATNAPSARTAHTAVWTGTEMIVWGGDQGWDDPPLNTGNRYHPATDTWAPTSPINAPSARGSHTAVWTGSEMIIWGGFDYPFTLNTGSRYKAAKSNQMDDAQFFVHQHYLDFLNREPDADGLAFWTNEILSCGGDAQCIDAKRINVSAAYFLSIEFQQTGYLVYRFYKASYGNVPGAPVPLRLNEFLPDTKEIGQGVIVNQSGWEQLLESNMQAFAIEFVQRSRFVSAYPTSMSSEQFVDALFSNAGVTLSASDRTAAINEFAFTASTADIAARARALRRVAENSTLSQQEFNRAFVLMQYFGYLRRNPNDAPEPTLDFSGYNFWLNKLNSFNGNFTAAEMVKAFLSSSEYRRRFGP